MPLTLLYREAVAKAVARRVIQPAPIVLASPDSSKIGFGWGYKPRPALPCHIFNTYKHFQVFLRRPTAPTKLAIAPPNNQAAAGTGTGAVAVSMVS